jgi:uncharacterized damage-inducible protein DinB
VTVSETETQQETLVHYLQTIREAVLWKIDGVSEYDVRRPLTPTGTNLLGLVKHLAYVELGYFVTSFGREMPVEDLFADPDADPHVDLYATADESRDDIVALYRLAWEEAARTFADHDLDSIGVVPWWDPSSNRVTLGRLLVHVVSETNRHAGHMDILREGLDGAAGLRAGVSNLPDGDYDWVAHVERVEAAALAYRAGS